MFALSEQEKLTAYYETYNNVRYNIAKKRRELGISQDMVSILSGISTPTVNKIESSLSENQDVKLSYLIDICLLFKMSIQDLFEMRPPIDSEESALMASLLKELKVSPSQLPQQFKNDFINFIGDDKIVDRNVFASWYRIHTLKNHAEQKQVIQVMLGRKIEKLEIGESHNYKAEYHNLMYAFIKKMPHKEFELRYVEPKINSCKRIK